MNRSFAKLIAGLIFFCLSGFSRAQVFNWSPVFPTVDDSLTITFNAQETNLQGVSQVFIHIGIVTQPNGTGWTNVQGNWGTADPRVQLTNLGNNQHRIKFLPRTFFNVSANQTVYRLGLLFRNAGGTTVTRATGGADFFMPMYQPGQRAVTFIRPAERNTLVSQGTQVSIDFRSSFTSNLQILVNGTQQAQQANGNAVSFNFTPSQVGRNIVKGVATDGIGTVSDSVVVFVKGQPQVRELPSGLEDGINYVDPNTVILVLRAPEKQDVFVIGDFNDWQLDTAAFMYKTPDGLKWWRTFSGLTPNTEYGFQYLVDGSIRIGDPYADKVLDPDQDRFVPPSVYPNLKQYPTGKTTGIVSILHPAEPAYNWQVNNFQKPDQTNLVIYELLIRDFGSIRSYKNVMDSIPYFKKLGINCLQLMPVNEFEGNLSWGYNPSYHYAIDKYYGSKNAFKALVDSCHANGISVVIDVVYNHGFSQCPLAQLYWDSNNQRPAPNNPWFNVTPRHPFNVGNDFNHESIHTQYYLDRNIKNLLETYRIDGFRFDLSKGFTQTNNPNNVGAWGRRDPSRIALLKRMYDRAREVSSDAYMILEHFADNDEEVELANYGFMFWGNVNFGFRGAVRGVTGESNLDGLSYRNRGWQKPHLVGYAESHDEERLMVDARNRPNTFNTAHNPANLTVALNRMKTAAAFLFSVPGPKMIWQFGEYGFDMSINRCENGQVRDDCRLANKPPLWDSLARNPERQKLLKVYSNMIKLKMTEPAFNTTTFRTSLGPAYKRIWLNHSSMNVVVLGNFSVVNATQRAEFQSTGKWYEYFSGDSITVTDVNQQITLFPSEFRIYTTKRLAASEPGLVPIKARAGFNASVYDFEVSPNPFAGGTRFSFYLSKPQQVEISIVDATGRLVTTLKTQDSILNGQQIIDWNGCNEQGTPVANGVYFIRLSGEDGNVVRKVVKE